MRGLLMLLAALLCAIGCSGGDAEKTEKRLSTRERDSILAESPLPGSGVVGKAISVSDSLDARTKRIDSQVQTIDDE
jgi:hypothetical protein